MSYLLDPPFTNRAVFEQWQDENCGRCIHNNGCPVVVLADNYQTVDWRDVRPEDDWREQWTPTAGGMRCDKMQAKDRVRSST